MQLNDAVIQLERCGIRRYEAVTFLQLAKLGTVSAREIARATGVSRVQIYRALNALETRGLVEVTLDRPRRYIARDLTEAFEIMIEERRTQLATAEQVSRSILSAWPSVAPKEKSSVRIQTLKGRNQIYGAMRRSIKAAKKEVLAFTTTKGITRSNREGINEALLEAINHGAAAKLIVDIQGGNAPLFTRVAQRVPLRHLEGQRGRFTIIDRESVFAFLVLDERGLKGEGETALWTNSPDFVRVHAEFFELAWRSGVPAEERIRALARR